MPGGYLTIPGFFLLSFLAFLSARFSLRDLPTFIAPFFSGDFSAMTASVAEFSRTSGLVVALKCCDSLAYFWEDEGRFGEKSASEVRLHRSGASLVS